MCPFLSEVFYHSIYNDQATSGFDFKALFLSNLTMYFDRIQSLYEFYGVILSFHVT